MEVRNWQYLEGDCLVKIFQKVGIEAMMKAVPFVCKSWYKTSLDPLCWTYLYFAYELPTEAIEMLIDRSCGNAIDVFFEQDLCFDDFIYISERCPKVNVVRLPKCLNWCYCSYKSRCDCKEKEKKIVPTVVRNWKNLQHLIIDTSFYFKRIINEVATHCKNLETLQVSCTVKVEISLKEVSVITSSLPRIKVLILGKGTEIPRECLLTLLSGCKELIRVDVRECFGFDADDEEILKMASHIKVFMAEGSKRQTGSMGLDLEQLFSLPGAIAEI
ncbi:hypothetical protein ACHQM5_011780 [Ranunculus cassubicifolius]